MRTPENKDSLRLDKYCAHNGISSRREAKKLIENGLVLVNGEKAEGPGQALASSDVVTLKPHAKAVLARKESVLIYKPTGVISGKQSDGNKTVFQVFPKLEHLHTVGRLDNNSEGLLILSNDGVLAKAVTGEHHGITKSYVVHTREPVLPTMIEQLSEGILIDKLVYASEGAEKLSRYSFRITLREGKKHHIRRMANECKLTITRLTRTRIGHLDNSKLKLASGGTYRLTKEDRNLLVAESRKHQD